VSGNIQHTNGYFANRKLQYVVRPLLKNYWSGTIFGNITQKGGLIHLITSFGNSFFIAIVFCTTRVLIKYNFWTAHGISISLAKLSLYHFGLWPRMKRCYIAMNKQTDGNRDSSLRLLTFLPSSMKH
jgi:hypothetical protein